MQPDAAGGPPQPSAVPWSSHTASTAGATGARTVATTATTGVTTEGTGARIAATASSTHLEGQSAHLSGPWVGRTPWSVPESAAPSPAHGSASHPAYPQVPRLLPVCPTQNEGGGEARPTGIVALVISGVVAYVLFSSHLVMKTPTTEELMKHGNA